MTNHSSVTPERRARPTDGDLLRQYVESRSERAFAELGGRYARLVYGTCLREVGDRSLAEDAAQEVFLLLHRKASDLQRSDSLAGWLYAASRLVSRNVARNERTRRGKESEAMAERSSAEPVRNRLWEEIEPNLHDALDRLKPGDREALLLRFGAQESFSDLGRRFEISENTARMRVSRAVESVRAHLSRAGITVSVALLALMLGRRMAHAAPAALIEALPAIARQGGPSAPGRLRLMTGKHARSYGLGTVWAGAIAAAGLVALCAFVAVSMARRGAETRQTRRFFLGLRGKWSGTLSFADDGSGKQYTYPANVAILAPNAGDDLQFMATYTGSTSVDVTAIRRNPDTGRTTVRNGGSQSSHQLEAIGSLLALPDSGFRFQGRSQLSGRDIRLTLQKSGRQLTVQEEYRAPGETTYRFRNRFTLQPR